MKLNDTVKYRHKRTGDSDRPDFIGKVIYIEPRGRFATVQGEFYKESFDMKDLEVVKI